MNQQVEINQWLDSAKRFPLLTANQEINLGRQVRDWLDAEDPTPKQIKRGIRAKDRMISCNLRLVVTIANRYKFRVSGTPAISIVDLYQDGVFGLDRAIRKWDPARGYKFSTYAYWWIRQCLNNAIQKLGDGIRMSNNVHTLLGRWSKKPGEQTIQEFAAEFGYTEDAICSALEYKRRARPCSLDVTIETSDGNAKLVDVLPDRNTTIAFMDQQRDLEDMISRMKEINPELMYWQERRHLDGIAANRAALEMNLSNSALHERLRSVFLTDSLLRRDAVALL